MNISECYAATSIADVVSPHPTFLRTGQPRVLECFLLYSSFSSSSFSRAWQCVLSHARLIHQMTLASHPLYSYTPSASAAVLFAVLFALSAIVHLVQTLRSRLWWTLLFFLCALGEFVGWIGRYVGHSSPANIDAFLDQQVVLILAPNFCMAGLYALFSLIVTRIGPQHALMRPCLYPIVFVSFDVLSLVIQAIGGGMAAVALQDDKDTTLGTWVMFGGVVFQLVCLLVFVYLAVDFARRVSRDIDNSNSNESITVSIHHIAPRFPWLCYGMIVSTVLLLIRGCYRSVELSQGWRGYLMVHEAFFLFLDAFPVLVSLFAINVTHPLFTMPLTDKFDGSSPLDSKETLLSPSLTNYQLNLNLA